MERLILGGEQQRRRAATCLRFATVYGVGAQDAL